MSYIKSIILPGTYMPLSEKTLMPLVIVESPYAARKEDGSWDNKKVGLHLKYVRAAMRDCLLRGEAPYASHALYTQEGVLDDQIPEQRELGMNAGFRWNTAANKTVVYTDYGVSKGMVMGIQQAEMCGRRVEYRTLPNFVVENE